MKKVISSVLLPQALLAAMLALFTMYAVGYSWVKDDTCSAMHASLLSVVPGLLAMLVATAIGSRAYWLASQEASANALFLPKKYLFASLAALTIALAFGLDYFIFNFCDDSLSQAYANGMRTMLSGGTLSVAEAELLQFAKTPFFSQNLGLNCIGIGLGYLLALPIAQSLLRRPRFA